MSQVSGPAVFQCQVHVACCEFVPLWLAGSAFSGCRQYLFVFAQDDKRSLEDVDEPENEQPFHEDGYCPLEEEAQLVV